MKLSIQIEQIEPGKIKASCPALPGCTVYGRTVEEVTRVIVLAVAAYLASFDTHLFATMTGLGRLPEA